MTGRLTQLLIVSLCGCDVVFGIKPPVDAPIDASVTYEGVVLADAPLAYWRFGADSALVAVDATPNGHTGMYVGNVAFEAGPLAGGESALMLDGVNAHVTMGNKFAFMGTEAFTVEAWVKRAMGLISFLGVISKVDESPDRTGWYLFSHPLSLGFDRWNEPGPGHIVQTGSPPPATWTYVAATYDGAKLTLYVNGEAVALNPGTLVIPPTTGAFVIGARDGGGHSFFKGSVDEVAVYNRALDATQIVRHYEVGIAP